MKVELKFISPLNLVVESIRTCYLSNWKSDSKWVLIKDLKKYNSDHYELGIRDKELIQQCIESCHESVLRHSLIHFEISVFPRSILQQVVRHNVGISYSVQSTRFTLKKQLREELPFISDGIVDYARVEKFIEITNIPEIDDINISTLEKVRQMAVDGNVPNDKLKNALPEVFKCIYRASYNIQSLRHFLKFRSASDAHYLIRELAKKMFEQIPQDQKFLFTDVFNDKY